MSFRTATALAALILPAMTPGISLAQSTMPDMPGMTMPAQPAVKPEAVPAKPDMSDMDMSGMDMSAHGNGGWMIHSHTRLSLVADNQEGPRGGNKTFLEGMTMIMASRAFGADNTLELEAMLSPDAFMGKDGYPLLLQTGETADGVHPLVDRQHPHDLFMGLSAQVTHRFAGDTRAFVKVGYPGEFAFGPTAFMHRASGEDFPTAPITHHWLDSGHITMGVVTAGVSSGPFTLETSRFSGREPDERRFNLDPVRLDSTSVRLTWRMTADLSAQASWARQVSPEELEPEVNLDKSSISLEYSHDFGTYGSLASTLAWGRKQVEHGGSKASDGYLFENSWAITPQWTALARFERVCNDELVPGAYWVGKAEIGGMRVFTLGKDASIGVGIVRQFGSVPDALKPVYGSHPDGTVAFVTLKLHSMKM